MTNDIKYFMAEKNIVWLFQRDSEGHLTRNFHTKYQTPAQAFSAVRYLYEVKEH